MLIDRVRWEFDGSEQRTYPRIDLKRGGYKGCGHCWTSPLKEGNGVQAECRDVENDSQGLPGCCVG